MNKDDSTNSTSDAMSDNIKRVLAVKALRKIGSLVKKIEKEDFLASRTAIVATFLVALLTITIYVFIKLQ